MGRIEGLGRIDRKRLSAVIRETSGTVSVSDATDILKVSRTDAAKMLARWANKGWLSRVRRGLYVPVPLEVSNSGCAARGSLADRGAIVQPLLHWGVGVLPSTGT